MNALLCVLALCSVSPGEARAKARLNAVYEASALCQVVEERICENYSDGAFSIKIEAGFHGVAYLVGQHFSDNWNVQWSDYRALRVTSKTPEGRYVILDGEEWKMTLTPKVRRTGSQK